MNVLPLSSWWKNKRRNQLCSLLTSSTFQRNVQPPYLPCRVLILARTPDILIRLFVVLLTPSGQTSGQYQNLPLTASLQIPYNLWVIIQPDTACYRDSFTLQARGSVVSWGSMLQAGRSRVRFPVRSSDFLIDLILRAELWPGSTQH
jgi:hypothetical protein